MRNEERELKIVAAVELTETAAKVLCAAATEANIRGTTILMGAHCYLYAALLADFMREAKHDDWIGPFVQRGDDGLETTEKFLMDHLFGVVFAPIAGGEEFLAEVRRKAWVLTSSEVPCEAK